MLHRIREMLKEKYPDLLQGLVEVDETYVGGKPRRNFRINKRGRGRGTSKIPVLGIVEGNGKVYTKVVSKTDAKTLTKFIRESVNIDKAVIISDEYTGYRDLKSFMQHNTINHSVEYVNGDIHTNTIEGFWSLLKRHYGKEFVYQKRFKIYRATRKENSQKFKNFLRRE